MSEIIRSIWKKAVIDIKLLFLVSRDLLSGKVFQCGPAVNDAKGAIIMVGAELFNKGAEAMVFTAVEQLKTLFPEKDIYLFSGEDFKRSEKEKSKYTFMILPWNYEIAFSLLGVSIGVIKRENPVQLSKIESVIRESAFFLDISGYALSSQWGFLHSVIYLLNIMVAKRFSVPYYIFPQSIGPFEYRLLDKMMISMLLRSYAAYPRMIYVREHEGIKWLRKYTRKNVLKSFDMVLCNKGYDQKIIFRETQEFRSFDIRLGTVAIIPNERVFERSDGDRMYSLYHALIKKLLSSQKEVIILSHSSEDGEICRKMYRGFDENGSIRLISEELNAIELEALLSKCEFIIASRYHSIIHAYKNGVPAVVIGWAAKYEELLKDFGQSSYFFDVLKPLDESALDEALFRMMRDLAFEKGKILKRIQVAQEGSPFRIIEEILAEERLYAPQ